MAFAPMMSSSPPPMMPDDIEDDELEDFGPNGDDEDEDSASYDLTGMSEKLRSIPKETIQVAPKEVVLPPALSEPSIPSKNGLPDCDENTLTNENEHQPKTEGHNEHSNDITEVQSDHPGRYQDDTKAIFDSKDDGNEEVFNDLEAVQGHPGPVKYDSKIIQGHQGSVQDDPNVVEDHPGLIQDEPKLVQDQQESSQDDQRLVQENPNPNDVQDHPGSVQDDQELFQDDPNAAQVHPGSLQDDLEDIPKPLSEEDQSLSQDNLEAEDDDFGNFEEASETQSVPVPPLNLDDNLEDDDFGDFEEVSASLDNDNFASSKGWASLESSPRSADVQAVDQILIGLQLKLASVISNLFHLSSPEAGLEDQGQPLDFGKEDCEDAVWSQVHSVSTTPALNQKWKETRTRNKLLKYLKIDPNNVIHQEPRMNKTSSKMPAFASGLGVTLEPIKAKETSTTATTTAATTIPKEVSTNSGSESFSMAATTDTNSIETDTKAPAAIPASLLDLDLALVMDSAVCLLQQQQRPNSSVNTSCYSGSNSLLTWNNSYFFRLVSEATLLSKRTRTDSELEGSFLSNGPSLLPNEDDYRGPSKKTSTSPNKVLSNNSRSASAQAILDSFPLLDFMQSPVLSCTNTKL